MPYKGGWPDLECYRLLPNEAVEGGRIGGRERWRRGCADRSPYNSDLHDSCRFIANLAIDDRPTTGVSPRHSEVQHISVAFAFTTTTYGVVFSSLKTEIYGDQFLSHGVPRFGNARVRTWGWYQARGREEERGRRAIPAGMQNADADAMTASWGSRREERTRRMLIFKTVARSSDTEE
ncbi:hypothetical protein F5148DRAFT_1151548 [Russula earlei]|uniref:Uncharacterized protein n=1 Tax=Russula earlei TaxID=71964 RepID=A0ACC0TZT9_9AGAM|nr:hypothetical protein F5148DRAFT_1151548 [Russula earlei]